MFPSVFSTFNKPTAASKLNSPSHSALHNTVSSALGQVEAVIGRSGNNSVLGTLIGDLRSPDSGGGGHIQTANKGGTGQTSFNKGDILVAQSSSVITKLAVGVDGLALVTDSATATGLAYKTFPGKVSATASQVIVDTNGGESSIVSITLPGSILGTNNAVRAVAYVGSWSPTNLGSVLVRGTYGGAVVASVILRPVVDAVSSVGGTMEFTLISNSSVAQQRGMLFVSMGSTSPGSVISATRFNANVSSVESSAGQSFGMTVTRAPGTTMYCEGAIIEKIT